MPGRSEVLRPLSFDAPEHSARAETTVERTFAVRVVLGRGRDELLVAHVQTCDEELTLLHFLIVALVPPVRVGRIGRPHVDTGGGRVPEFLPGARENNLAELGVDLTPGIERPHEAKLGRATALEDEPCAARVEVAVSLRRSFVVPGADAGFVALVVVGGRITVVALCADGADRTGSRVAARSVRATVVARLDEVVLRNAGAADAADLRLVDTVLLAPLRPGAAVGVDDAGGRREGAGAVDVGAELAAAALATVVIHVAVGPHAVAVVEGALGVVVALGDWIDDFVDDDDRGTIRPILHHKGRPVRAFHRLRVVAVVDGGAR